MDQGNGPSYLPHNQVEKKKQNRKNLKQFDRGEQHDAVNQHMSAPGAQAEGWSEGRHASMFVGPKYLLEIVLHRLHQICS